MKKVIALVLALGLFLAAPAMAAEDDILTGVSQSEVTALADNEMSQIQGELYLAVLVKTDADAVLLGLLGAVLGLLPH